MSELAAGTRTVRLARRLRHPLLLVPGAVLLGVVFAYPLVRMIATSFVDETGFGLGQYAQLLETPTYAKVFLITFEIAVWVTVVTVAVAYPFAYVIVTGPPALGNALRFLVIVPFLVSLLVRTYGWMVILTPAGILNELLGVVGLGPVSLLFNRAGVILGMTYALLPYMVFTLYGNMRSIDRRLLDAAHSLGASRWQAFRTVFLPLTFPGIVAGALLVFILACGFFITPKLMGGPSDVMIGSLIATLVSESGRMDEAAAIGTILLAVTSVGFVVLSRFVRLRTLFESRI